MSLDEQAAFDAIEKAAAPLIEQGWEPTDSEPGEWLTLTKDGHEITITPNGEEASK